MTDDAQKPVRRARRRAERPSGTVGGDESVLRSTVPAAPEPARPATPSDPTGAAAAIPPATVVSGAAHRAPDDLDVGWGAPVDDSNDDRLNRERPPHW